MYPLLYKYCKSQKQNEHLLDIFKKSHLHLTPHSKLNDIFECKILFDKSYLLNNITEETDHFKEFKNKQNPNATIEYYRSLLSVQLEERERMKEVYKELYIDVSFGITCFSKTNKNDILWAYYTDSFKGLCIEFDFNEYHFDLMKNKILREVVYTDNDYYITSADDLREITYRKKTCYIGEKEWRVSVPLDKDKLFMDFQKPIMKGIYFGINMHPEYTAEVIYETKELGYKLKYYEMYSEFDNFDIHFREMKV